MSDPRIITVSVSSTAGDKLQIFLQRGAACASQLAASTTATSTSLRYGPLAAADTYCIKVDCQNYVYNCGAAQVSISWAT